MGSVVEWNSFINSAINGMYNGQSVTQKALTPVLYYYYALMKIVPNNTFNTSYEVDHIIPQEKFSDNNMVNPDLKDSLTKKYSDITNIQGMVTLRGNLYINAFNEIRTSILSN